MRNSTLESGHRPPQPAPDVSDEDTVMTLMDARNVNMDRRPAGFGREPRVLSGHLVFPHLGVLYVSDGSI